MGWSDRFDHIAANAAKLSDGHVLKAFASLIELFVDLDGRLLHDGMGFLAPAHKNEVLAAGQSSFPVVVVKGHSQQGGRFANFVGCSHGCLSVKFTVS